jgi:hypothetical protein
LGWSSAPHWATISHVTQPTSASTGASDQFYFVWDTSIDKSTSSDKCRTYKRYYNVVYVLKRSNLGWPPAPHWASIKYLPLSTSASTGASDQFYFVWDTSKGKATG